MIPSNRAARARARGFTLLELMVVIVIIGVLTAIVISNLIRMSLRAKEASTKDNMHTLLLAAEDYAVQSGGAYAMVLDANHIVPQLPSTFSNPFDHSQGQGHAWEDRAALDLPPTPLSGIVSYADSDTVAFNIKGYGASAPLHLVLVSGH